MSAVHLSSGTGQISAASSSANVSGGDLASPSCDVPGQRGDEGSGLSLLASEHVDRALLLEELSDVEGAAFGGLDSDRVAHPSQRWHDRRGDARPGAVVRGEELQCVVLVGRRDRAPQQSPDIAAGLVGVRNPHENVAHRQPTQRRGVHEAG
jgi:hypothetical protein